MGAVFFVTEIIVDLTFWTCWLTWYVSLTSVSIYH